MHESPAVYLPQAEIKTEDAMDFTIEKAKAADAKAILAFTRTCGAETDNLSFGAEGIPVSTEEEASFLASMENSETGIFLVARDGTEIIGTASYSAFTRKRMSHRGELGISVKRAYWYRGVGTALLRDLLDFAKNVAKSEIVSLSVRCDNAQAIRLYEKFGFEKIGSFRGYLKIDGALVDCDMMELFL